MSDYLPSAKIRLGIRFDEFGDTSLLTKKVPKATTTNLNGIKTARAGLVPITVVTGTTSTTTMGSPSQTGTGGPQDQDASSDGLSHTVGGIVPKEAKWEQGSIHDGDHLKLSFRFLDCPIDPRTVRACAIQYFLGTVGAADYAAGLQGITRGDRSPGASHSDEPVNMVADTYLDSNNKQRTNLRFEGWVDEWTVDWTNKDEPMIHLTCSDNTRLFIDQKMPSSMTLDAKKPIEKAVADFLSNFPQFQGIDVVFLPAGTTGPVIGSAFADSALRPGLGPPAAKGGAASHPHSIWDYLTDICACLGLTIRVRGTQVILQSVRNYLAGNGNFSRPDDPFQSRTLADGTTIQTRQFIWGRNVSKKATSRKFFHGVPKNVELRCTDSGKKTVLVARFPEAADRLAYALPGNATPDGKWAVHYVAGIKDYPTLLKMAQEYYELQSRYELKVDIETEHLASFGGDNEDPDLLDLKSGDSFEELTSRTDTDPSTLTRIESVQQLMEIGSAFMQKLGFGKDFADAYSKAYTNAGFQTVYKVQTVSMDWNVDSGVKIKIVGINYVEIRADKKFAQDPQTGVITSVAGTPPKAGP